MAHHLQFEQTEFPTGSYGTTAMVWWLAFIQRVRCLEGRAFWKITAWIEQDSQPQATFQLEQLIFNVLGTRSRDHQRLMSLGGENNVNQVNFVS